MMVIFFVETLQSKSKPPQINGWFCKIPPVALGLESSIYEAHKQASFSLNKMKLVAADKRALFYSLIMELIRELCVQMIPTQIVLIDFYLPQF